MRAGRPVIVDLLRQGRRALAWAGALSGCAAVLGLAVPLFAWHAVDAALRVTPLDALVPVSVFVLALLGARAAMLSARDRMIVRAGLWVDHMSAKVVLADGVASGMSGRNLIADREALARVARVALSRSPVAVLDASWAIVPALALMLVHPVLGLVALVALALVAGVAAVVIGRTGTLAAETAEAAERASESWRTTAHNANALVQRGLAEGLINDWQGLDSRATSLAYRLVLAATPVRRAARVVEVACPVIVAALGAWLVLVDGIGIGGLVAAALLAVQVSGRTARAADATADMMVVLQAWRRLDRPTEVESRRSQVELTDTVPSAARASR